MTDREHEPDDQSDLHHGDEEQETPGPKASRPPGVDPATNGTLLSRRPDTDPRDTGQQLSVSEGK